MVAKGFTEEHLSLAARKRGIEYANYLCYEEDVAWEIVAFELKSPYRNRFIDEHVGVIREKYDRDDLLRTLSYFYADYLIEIGVEPVEPQYTRYKKSQLSDQMRKEKHPDLIICATGSWGHHRGPGVVKVLTADGAEHFVTSDSYDRKDPHLNLLSNCVLA